MEYIVLDMEWNQPYAAQRAVHKLCGEVVQIGAVKLDARFRIMDTLNILIKPRYYAKMHKTVSKLTGITTKQLECGISFVDAFRQFKAWCGPDCAYLTWGPDDMRVLRENMAAYRLDPQQLPACYDAQLIFDDQVTKQGRQLSLTYAMELLEEPALKAHDALNDARNTAVICRHLDMEKGLAEYDELRERLAARRGLIRVQERAERAGSAAEPERSGFSGERDRQAKTYSNYRQALRDRALNEFFCPQCGATMTCGGAVRQNIDKFMSIGRCPAGHEIFVRFKFRRWPDGLLTVNRILRELDDQTRSYYARKKDRPKTGRARRVKQPM